MNYIRFEPIYLIIRILYVGLLHSNSIFYDIVPFY